MRERSRGGAVAFIALTRPKWLSVKELELRMSRSSRLAYSTETGSICSRCGQPRPDCTCVSGSSSDEPVPEKITARLRIEKSGRKGKTVTIVDGLPANGPFLDQLAKELKKACGSGGTVATSRVEIQGDHRDKLRIQLRKKGWAVKG